VNEPGNQLSLGGSNVHSTCVTRDKRMFVAVNADPIYEYDRANDNFKEVSYRLAYQGNNSSKTIVEDQNGLLYITSEFSALHIYNPQTGQSTLVDKAGGLLNTDNIRTRVLPLNNYEVWVGTDGGGINIYNSASGEVQYLMMDTKNSKSLSGNAITKMFEDRDKNIWIGHFGTGISVWKRNKEKFESFSHNPFNPESINKEVVSAIFEDSKGRIWIGQDGGGLSLFNETSKTFEHIRRKAETAGTLTSDVILAIIEDPSGNLLLGTYAGGMMVFNPETKKVIKSYNSANGMASDHVWTFFIDSKGRYWLSDLRAGYSLYDPINGTFENHAQGTDPLSACSNSVMTLSEDKNGKLWMGAENGGVCVIDYDKKEKKNYTFDPSNINSLSNNDVKSIIFIDPYVWIATNGGGLNRLDLNTDSFKIYTMKDGLSSDALQGMLKDKADNLWISSTKGLMKFHTKTGEVELFDKSQGIQGNEFKYNSQLILSNGKMMFGGVNGLTVFHPDSIKNSNIKASVVFTDLEILNQSVIPGAKGSPLTKHINYTEYLKLNHKESVFTIKFASLDYNSPEKNRYMYKLEGFDEEWVNAGTRRSVTYTNLDPGKYTFLLKGSNSDGVWNDIPRKIIIRVRPPWYTTKFSIILYIIVVTLGVILYIRQREKQVVQDKLILEQKIEEAQSELKAKTKKVEEHAEEIKRRDEEEKDIRFYTDGIARLSDIIAKKRKNLEELSTSMISELTRYVGGSAGGIFVMDDSDPNHIMLRATGEFCLSSETNKNYVFEEGEGSVGACFKEKQTLISDNLPEGYLIMRSGLGSISLHHAIYVPIMQDKDCVGVIEIASLEKLTDNKVRFTEKIAESLASIIVIIRANEKSSQMIEQNNAQAEELRTQEEEMRQNMEELMATQEESQRREKDIMDQINAKNELIHKLQRELAGIKKK
jgi:streptogramin lyase